MNYKRKVITHTYGSPFIRFFSRTEPVAAIITRIKKHCTFYNITCNVADKKKRVRKCLLFLRCSAGERVMRGESMQRNVHRAPVLPPTSPDMTPLTAAMKVGHSEQTHQPTSNTPSYITDIKSHYPQWKSIAGVVKMKRPPSGFRGQLTKQHCSK